jgi:hypothetical protein
MEWLAFLLLAGAGTYLLARHLTGWADRIEAERERAPPDDSR